MHKRNLQTNFRTHNTFDKLCGLVYPYVTHGMFVIKQIDDCIWANQFDVFVSITFRMRCSVCFILCILCVEFLMERYWSEVNNSPNWIADNKAIICGKCACVVWKSSTMMKTINLLAKYLDWLTKSFFVWRSVCGCLLRMADMFGI